MNKSRISFFGQNDLKNVTENLILPLQPHFHETIFPRVQTFKLDYEAISANVFSTAAPTHAFGQASPLGKRPTAKKRGGTINAISQSLVLDEKLLLELDNPAAQSSILRAITNDAVLSYNAVLNRMDFISMQEMSTGKVTYSGENNAGGFEDITIDYELESFQKQVVPVKWSVAATATPLKDIRNMLEVLAEKRIYPEIIRMSKTVFNRLIQTAEVQKLKITKSNVVSEILTLSEFNIYMTSRELPTIEIVQDKVTYLDVNGNVDMTKRAWSVDNIQFGYKKEGTSFWLPPVEQKTAKLTKSLFSLVNGVGILKYADANYINEITKAKAIMFPVWNRFADALLVNTESTTTF